MPPASDQAEIDPELIAAGPAHLLRDRTFGPYFAGNVLSTTGTWVQNVAAALLAYDLTGSTFMVGVVNFANFAAALLLAPLAGGAADHFDRRRLLMTANTACAAITGALAWVTYAGHITVWLLVASMAMLGIAIAFMAPGLMAFVPTLVRRSDLESAMALTSASMNIGRTVGPLVAAWLVHHAGHAAAFAVNSMSFAIFVAVLATFRVQSATLEEPSRRPKLREAFDTVRSSPFLPALLVAVAAASVGSDPLFTLTPAFAVEVYGHGSEATGVLVGAFGVGGLVMVAVLTRLRGSHPVATGMWVLGVGMIGFALGPNFGLGLVSLGIAGAGFLLTLTTATARIQGGVPEQQLGRTMAVWSVCFLGTRPPAALLDGALAEVAGPRAAAAFMGCIPLAVAVWLRVVVARRIQLGVRDAEEDNRSC